MNNSTPVKIRTSTEQQQALNDWAARAAAFIDSQVLALRHNPSVGVQLTLQAEGLCDRYADIVIQGFAGDPEACAWCQTLLPVSHLVYCGRCRADNERGLIALPEAAQ